MKTRIKLKGKDDDKKIPIKKDELKEEDLLQELPHLISSY